jgi:hypothetical protein
MNKTPQVEIQLSKFKLILLFLGSLMFVLFGTAFIMNPSKFVSPICKSPAIIFIAGLAGISFFGFVGFSIFKKIFDNKPGLLISDDGMIDNSSGLSAGYIPWSDVTEIKEKKVINQKYISIVVKNPWDYIKKQPNFFRRKAMQKNYELFGAVIGISTNGLKYDYSNLLQLLRNKFEEYKIKTNK